MKIYQFKDPKKACKDGFGITAKKLISWICKHKSKSVVSWLPITFEDRYNRPMILEGISIGKTYLPIMYQNMRTDNACDAGDEDEAEDTPTSLYYGYKRYEIQEFLESFKYRKHWNDIPVILYMRFMDGHTGEVLPDDPIPCTIYLFPCNSKKVQTNTPNANHFHYRVRPIHPTRLKNISCDPGLTLLPLMSSNTRTVINDLAQLQTIATNTVTDPASERIEAFTEVVAPEFIPSNNVRNHVFSVYAGGRCMNLEKIFIYTRENDNVIGYDANDFLLILRTACRYNKVLNMPNTAPLFVAQNLKNNSLQIFSITSISAELLMDLDRMAYRRIMKVQLATPLYGMDRFERSMRHRLYTNKSIFPLVGFKYSPYIGEL